MRLALPGYALAAILLSVPAFAQVSYEDGGNVAYTEAAQGVSSATGTSQVSLSGFPDGWAPNTPMTQGGTTISYTNLGGVDSTDGLYAPGGAVVHEPFVYSEAGSGAGAASGATTMSFASSRSYFGAMFDATLPASGTDTVSFYENGTLEATVPLDGTAVGNGLEAGYVNVDFLNGTQFNKVVLNTTAAGGQFNGGALASLDVAKAPVSLTNLASATPPASPAPLPPLGGTMGGVAALAATFCARRMRRAA
jgi:hypothetical protein